jgi:hypothetical protein
MHYPTNEFQQRFETADNKKIISLEPHEQSELT